MSCGMRRWYVISVEIAKTNILPISGQSLPIPQDLCWAGVMAGFISITLYYHSCSTVTLVREVVLNTPALIYPVKWDNLN